jgi:DNA-binding beta-propeller fold protein YncE
MTYAVSCESPGAGSDRSATKEMTAVDRRQQRRRIARIVLLALMASTLAACAWLRTEAHPSAEAFPHLVWPEPPDRARIELVSFFTRASDLGIERSVWARLATLITGGGELQLVRPAGVAASGGRIAVADPGAGVVHVYDLSERRSLALQACGKTALSEPVAVAMLGDRLYVSDSAAARIHVFTFDGECAGGWVLDPGARPAGLAADAARSRLYVADAGAHEVLGFDLHGQRVLRFGSRGSAPGEFNFPTWLAVDADGNLYVSDALNFRVQIFDLDGKQLGTFGTQGDASGDLARPKGIGVDRNGTIYLVDALFDAVQMFDREGRYLMVFGSHGSEPGHFSLPSGLAIDGDRIYVADSYNRRVQTFRILGGEP